MGMRDGMNIEEVMRGVEMQSNHEKMHEMSVCTLLLKFYFYYSSFVFQFFII